MKKTTPHSVPVADLKARLSEYLRLVKEGRELIVTDRGRPIATIAPVIGNFARTARVEDLIATGAVRAPTRALEIETLRRKRPADEGGRLLEILLDERAEGR